MPGTTLSGGNSNKKSKMIILTKEKQIADCATIKLLCNPGGHRSGVEQQES